MKNRTYNILFHTHTISGIIISALLYIIFFAGSFSFFRDEIVNWERNDVVKVTDDLNFNINQAFDSIKKTTDLYGRDIEIRKYYIEQQLGVSISASKDTLATEDEKISSFFYLDTKDFSQHSYNDSYTLGEFLYRLHFLAQIRYPIGYYLSGFVALFFLFAILTGVLVHWKKIVSNFYVFRPLEKLKTIWTDAHTTLGMIGMPFQFVYAITGAFFMIKLLLVAPNVMMIYNGDQDKFYEELGYSHPKFENSNIKLEAPIAVSTYIDKTKKLWNDFMVTETHIFNYGDENMHVLVGGHLAYNDRFNGIGEIIYKVNTGEIILQKTPIASTSYLDVVKNVLYRIHYGDYGGYALRIISFLLGLITCFVIISGVMIWLVARNKKNIPEKKRRFNEWLVNIYAAICLSMFPITALSFIAVKIVQPTAQSFIYNFYFIGWLLLSIIFILKKNLYFTNKSCLLLGSIFGFLVPISNGIITNNWFWKSFREAHTQLFFVDVFWIFISFFGFLIFFKLKKKKDN